MVNVFLDKCFYNKSHSGVCSPKQFIKFIDSYQFFNIAAAFGSYIC